MSLALWQDVRYGVRMLARSPSFSLVATFTLALGIGSNTAIFTVANALLLRPLPYANPERLVLISASTPSQGAAQRPFSFPRYTFLEEHYRSLSGMAAFTPETFNLTDGGEPEQLAAARVSKRFFEVLGVRGIVGRTFLPDEDKPGGKAVVLISHSLWTRRFASDPHVLGRTLTLDSRPYTIVGVTPLGFQFAFAGATVDVWAPKVFELNLATPDQIQRGAGYLNAVARLQTGIMAEQAQAEMNVLNQQYLREYPKMADADPKLVLSVGDLRDQLVANARPAVLILFGAVGLVLLIACANVASLLLSRALGRRKEIAVRAALGASRARLIRQLLTESVLLAMMGGILGLLVSDSATQALTSLAQGNLPRIEEIRTDGAVLTFSLVISLITGVLFGLMPALEISRADLNRSLRDEARGTTGKGRNRLRAALVISQVALSIVLLIGAGLLIRSFTRLVNVNPGFEPGNVLTMNVTLPPARYGANPPMVAFFDQLLPDVERTPGVQSAAIASALPLNPSRFTPVLLEGQPPLPVAQRPVLAIETISPAYFATMRTPLVRGRLFTARDNAQAPGVAIVNQALARRYWPGANPIGKHIHLGTRVVPVEVVGVAGDIKNITLSAEPQPEIYLPFPQLPWRSMNLVVRTAGDPHGVATSLRREVAALDRDQTVTAIQTLEEVLGASRARPRLVAFLLGVFSTAAMLLAVVGIYGTISYSVAQRTQELGIRMALGAGRGEILAMVVRQGVALTLAGVLLGWSVSLACTHTMSSLLYDVSPVDPATFLSSALLFGGAALLASYMPALRATCVDPATALRRG